MISDFSSSQWFDFGKHLGDMLERVFLGTSSLESMNPVVLPIEPIMLDSIAWNQVGLAVEGILVGFGEEFSGNFGTCMNDAV